MRYGAFGLVEVVGSSNAVIVIDQMLKTADVSAVTAAVQAVKENPPCEIVFAAVISNPSEETIRLAEEDAEKHGFLKKPVKKAGAKK